MSWFEQKRKKKENVDIQEEKVLPYSKFLKIIGEERKKKFEKLIYWIDLENEETEDFPLYQIWMTYNADENYDISIRELMEVDWTGDGNNNNNNEVTVG